MENFSVTQNGLPLSKTKYTWNEDTRTFSSLEDDLVLDFNGIDGCVFNTGSYCTFTTGSYCTFTTGYNCTFTTYSNCSFTTSYNCTFDTSYYCTFTTGSDCVVIRRDVFEVINLVEKQTIKLNNYLVKGFKVVPKNYNITIGDKVVELSEESYNNLKEQLK
ncbi:MAG: hypothetical protein ACTSQE_17195 [Candidatus Heimdallarchaeaceae archaeon]